jgi:cell division protein FtsB
MARTQGRARRRRRLSLSVRVSLLLLCAALLPLAAVVGINDYLARNTLIQQGTNSLTTDVNAKVAQLSAYVDERVQDGEALASLPTAIAFLACADLPTPPPELNCAVQQALTYQPSVERALAVGWRRDKNYTTWSLYDITGHALLSSSKPGVTPPSDMTVPAEDLSPVLKQGRFVISGVYYDPKASHAFIYLYAPITPTPGQPVGLANPVLGFLRATLQMDYIWDVVASEASANGAGSYAFILDENGVRIADTQVDERFTAITPIDASTQQVLSTEQRYGTSDAVPIFNVPALANVLKAADGAQSFQSVATPGAKTTYQFVALRFPVSADAPVAVPWTYVVLSPLSTVTQVADNQLRTSLLSAAVIAVLAMLLGLLVGTRTANPVQRSVAELQGATETLNELAARQQNSAGEQQWVVDACKTGLESVRYLSDAMNQAARRIVEASHWFNQYWDRLTEEQAQRTVQHLRELAQYIEEAARRQQASSERLDKAITVTTQVTDQLANGAAAAAQSAEQLDVVVDQLLRVVGGKPRAGASQPGAAENMETPEHTMPAPDGWMERDHSPSGHGLMLPEPVIQRRLPGGVASGRHGDRPELLPGAWPGDPASGAAYGQPGSAGYGFGQSPNQGFGQPPSQGSAQGGWPDLAANGNSRGVRVWEER